MTFSFKKIKQWYEIYERHITTGAFILGFIIDNFTLTRIDLLYNNLILLSYLAVASLGIVGYNIYTSNIRGARFLAPIARFLPLFVQFAFGGLFSGFTIFYTRSASLAASWPFLLLLLSLLLGNELFRKYYLRFSFQVSILFFALFSYLIFYVPIIVDDIGPGVFMVSGIVSILLLLIFLRLLGKIMPKRIEESKATLTLSVTGIFLAINVLYFTNIIPPIPLSLKDAGIYHNIERIGAETYKLTSEEAHWYNRILPTHTVHVLPGETLYMFSSVFAPTDLDTHIFHVWQYYNEQEDKWVVANRIGFPIIGGRDGGYRGYTLKANIFPGLWRVDVVTEYDQLLGREEFRVVEVPTRPVLQTVVQ